MSENINGKLWNAVFAGDEADAEHRVEDGDQHAALPNGAQGG